MELAKENRAAGYRNITFNGIDAYLDGSSSLITSRGLEVPRNKLEIAPLGSGVFWTGFFNSMVLCIYTKNEKISVPREKNMLSDHDFLSVVDEFLQSRDWYVAQAIYLPVRESLWPPYNYNPRLRGFLYEMRYERYLIDLERKAQEPRPDVAALAGKV